jgi:hypothetical protein
MLEDWPDVSDRGSPKELPAPNHSIPEKTIYKACAGVAP